MGCNEEIRTNVEAATGIEPLTHMTISSFCGDQMTSTCSLAAF